MQAVEEPSSLLVSAIERHGREAIVFEALKPGIETWLDEQTDAVVAYVDTGVAWVTAGAPLIEAERFADVARRFTCAAGIAHRRVAWFATETCVEGYPALRIGEQPEWRPSDWPEVIAKSRSLREQLRRARAAGVTIRRVTIEDAAPGTELRANIDALAAAWLHGKHMEPMQFLVTLSPWQCPERHRYFVAERKGTLVAFLSLVPIPARTGWLFEDLLRGSDAPNGTSELLIDSAMRAIAAEGAEVATLGLSPLSGPVAAWLRAARAIGGGLYGFRGLRAFKQRLHPHVWKPIWLMVSPGGHTSVGLFDALLAFMGRRRVRFLVRTLLRHPSGACVALAGPLIPWTLALAALAMSGGNGPLGYSRGALAGWTLFDVALDTALWWTALHPKRWALGLLALFASMDATASVLRVIHVGMGDTVGTALLRAIAVAAPTVGAALLTWSALRANA